MKWRENFFFCGVTSWFKSGDFCSFIRIIQSKNEGLTRFPVCPCFINRKTLIDNLSSESGGFLLTQVTLMLEHIKRSLERENFKFSFILKSLGLILFTRSISIYTERDYDKILCGFIGFAFHAMFNCRSYQDEMRMKNVCQKFRKKNLFISFRVFLSTSIEVRDLCLVM